MTVLRCSPLDRAVETAAPIAQQFGLEAVTDDRLIEPWNHFEGMPFGVGDGSLRHPAHWWPLRNPFRPSWGEPYKEVAARMLAAVPGRGPGRPRARGRVRQPPAADLGHPAARWRACGCGTTRAAGSARWAA